MIIYTTMTEIDLTREENWSMENAGKIAEQLGFVCNDVFLIVLENFIIEKVSHASITLYLSTIAVKFFKRSGAETVDKK